MDNETEHVAPVPEVTPADIPVGTHLFEQEYLYAFATAQEIAGYVRMQAAEEDRERLGEIMAGWAAVQPRVQALVAAEGGLPDGVEVGDVPPEHQALVDEFMAHAIVERAFPLPYEVKVVEIDKVTAYQRAVHLGYVGRITERLGANPAPEDILRLCVSPQREMDPIQHLALGDVAHTFSSPNSDIRFLGAFLKRDLTPEDLAFSMSGGVPAAAIIAFVGYGTPMVNGFLVGNRVILNNGFHRVVALRRLGIKRIPLVLQRVTNPQLEMAPDLGGLPRDYFTQAPRPPLVKDFLEPGFTVTLRVRERMRVLTLAVQAGPQDVPV